ncbi:MAG: thioredoxin family protein [Mollicutes bacterium]|jgi:thioredoxin 1|nr:thioredoxin family protein [Mollicutes bacterium]
MEYLSGQNLEDVLDVNVTLVDYFASWCGPCQMLSLELEDLSEREDNLKIIKVDVDNHQELAQSKGIMSVPFVEIYKNKKLITSFLGFKTKEEIQNILKEI